MEPDVRVDFYSPNAILQFDGAEDALIWIESPSNPTLRLVDIAALARAKRSCDLLVVDSTFATPMLQNPLALGADLVVHSATKYLGGHSDAVLGLVCGNCTELKTRLRFLQNTLGAVPSPFDCYLVLRGIKTLALRMQRHCENALAIATFLKDHPAVERVYHPLLEFPELAKRQQSGLGGGIVSFVLRSNAISVSDFCTRCRIFTLAESLGCVESLCEVPAVMTHASLDPSVRKSLGISEHFVRLSVGIEDIRDLIADLSQALRL